jgi:hypothetical protein
VLVVVYWGLAVDQTSRLMKKLRNAAVHALLEDVIPDFIVYYISSSHHSACFLVV